MTATLNFEVRNHMRELYPEHRWGVLTVLMLHADIRNRCWPSIDLIAHEMSLSPSKVSRAKKWLLEHGAIELVPYEQRIDAEKKAGPRQHVYQLTGKVKIDGKDIPYLYYHEPEAAPEVNPSNGGNFKVSNGGNTAVDNINAGNLSISSEDNISKEENTNTEAAKAAALEPNQPKPNPPNLKAVPKKPSKVPKKVPLPQHGELKVLIHRYGFDDADSRVTWARSSDVATALLDDDPTATPAEFQSFADDWIALPGKPNFPCGTDTLPINYAKWKAGRNGHTGKSNAEDTAERQRRNAAELERAVVWDDDGAADTPGAPGGLSTDNRSAA